MQFKELFIYNESMPNEHFELDPTRRLFLKQIKDEERKLTAQEFVSIFPSVLIDTYDNFQLQIIKKGLPDFIGTPLPITKNDDEITLQKQLIVNRSSFAEMEDEDNDFFWDEVFEDEILLQLQDIRSSRENSDPYSRAIRARMNVVAHRLLRERGFLAQAESNAA
jgi:hypothetical protein